MVCLKLVQLLIFLLPIGYQKQPLLLGTFVGGCASGSVVDGSFKVMGGLSNLRVIDASVIPRMTTSSGLLASTYMLAEFASDIRIKEYTCSHKTKSTPKEKKCQKKTKETKKGKKWKRTHAS